MALTLQIPDSLAEQLRIAADAESEDTNHYAVAKLTQALSTEDEAADSASIAALQKANDEMDAGHFLTMDQIEASAHAALAARPVKIAA